jgi:intracellular septation protein
MTARTERHPSGAASFALDFGPLLVFFLVYKMGGIMVGTVAFMVAILVAIGIGLALYRRVSPMSWLSAVLILGFGSLTLYFHDARFTQLKPTVMYIGLSAILFAGLLLRRPLLKPLLGQALTGLSDRGWMLLSRNWALYFLGLAVANEVLRRTLSFDAWLTIKVWGVTALSFLFTLANTPMLLKHGLDLEGKKDVPLAPPE